MFLPSSSKHTRCCSNQPLDGELISSTMRLACLRRVYGLHIVEAYRPGSTSKTEYRCANSENRILLSYCGPLFQICSNEASGAAFPIRLFVDMPPPPVLTHISPRCAWSSNCVQRPRMGPATGDLAGLCARDLSFRSFRRRVAHSTRDASMT